MTTSSTRLFPLLIALLLAVLSYALERAVRDAPLAPEPRRHDPDYVVEHFVLTAYALDGSVEARASADKMLHYPDSGTTDIIALRAVLSKPGEPRYTGRAARGAIADDGEELFLYDNVVVVREADATRPEARLETQFLHVVGGRALARSDREVVLRDGGRELIGRGMEFHHESKRFFLRERVRGRFEAQPLRKAQ
jgi:lipopolysaccharide export system protein LptC